MLAGWRKIITSPQLLRTWTTGFPKTRSVPTINLSDGSVHAAGQSIPVSISQIHVSYSEHCVQAQSTASKHIQNHLDLKRTQRPTIQYN
ncbi:hypothetical protein BJX65DRAFT_251792 [Aspergillus insuetus]